MYAHRTEVSKHRIFACSSIIIVNILINRSNILSWSDSRTSYLDSSPHPLNPSPRIIFCPTEHGSGDDSGCQYPSRISNLITGIATMMKSFARGSMLVQKRRGGSRNACTGVCRHGVRGPMKLFIFFCGKSFRALVGKTMRFTKYFDVVSKQLRYLSYLIVLGSYSTNPPSSHLR